MSKSYEMPPTRPYSTGEIDSLLFKLEKRIGTRLGAFHNERLTQINDFQKDVHDALEDIQKGVKGTKDQLDIMSKRVGRLETDRKIVYAFIAAFIVIGVPVIGYFMLAVINIPDTIQNAITQTLKTDLLLKQVNQ